MSSEQVISLIGFPGSGKSTLGVLLAKRLGTDFVDTDILIQNQEKATLAEIIGRRDHVYLRQLEEQVLLDMPIHPAQSRDHIHDTVVRNLRIQRGVRHEA